jgi:hypothetical protein
VNYLVGLQVTYGFDDRFECFTVVVGDLGVGDNEDSFTQFSSLSISRSKYQRAL